MFLDRLMVHFGGPDRFAAEMRRLVQVEAMRSEARGNRARRHLARLILIATKVGSQKDERRRERPAPNTPVRNTADHVAESAAPPANKWHWSETFEVAKSG
jgi:hypothetical protein